ncbi:MAG TPA: DUF4870 domain-containing protein [Planctomycetaceae bacterium]|jgi:hypothetical protein
MSDQHYSDQMPDQPYFAEVPTADRQWAMFAHLSALVAIWLGGFGFLGPLIVWLIKKDEMQFVDDQGKEALNFQLNVFIVGAAISIVVLPVAVLTLGLGLLLLLPVWIGLGVVDIILSIVAAISVNGGATYRYPFIIRLVK